MTSRSEALLAKYRTLITTRPRVPGESIETFCKSIGISVYVYHYWKRRILNQSAAAPFIPVTINTPLPTTMRVEVLLTDGTKLFVPQELLSATLQSLFKRSQC